MSYLPDVDLVKLRTPDLPAGAVLVRFETVKARPPVPAPFLLCLDLTRTVTEQETP